MKRIRYPFLDIFPRVRGVFLLDEDREIFFSSPKRKTMENLMPGLLHAAGEVSRLISEQQAYNVKTGKLRIHTVKEETPFPYFTTVVVNREASKQVGMWTTYLSKLVRVVLQSQEIKELTRNARRLVDKTVSREIEMAKVPEREKVIKFASQAYSLINNKEEISGQLLNALDKEKKKEVKGYHKFISSMSPPETSSLQRIYDLIDQGALFQAFLLAENHKEEERFIILWVALGLLLKNLYYEVPAPSLEELEEQLQRIQEEKYASLTRLLKFGLKKLKSAQEGVEALNFLKKEVEEVSQNLESKASEYQLYAFDLILRGLISPFLPVERSTLNSLERRGKLGGKISVSLWWEPEIHQQAIYSPILPYFLMRGFNWEEIQPFFHALLKRSETVREKAKQKANSIRDLRYQGVHLNTIRAAFGLFSLSVTRAHSLGLSDKEILIETFQSKLKAVLEEKKRSLSWIVPLTHLGLAAAHANKFIVQNKESSAKKWRKHGREAIREILRLNKRHRMGDLLTLVLLLIALDVLHLKLEKRANPFPEVLIAFKWLLDQNNVILKALGEIISPYYLRRVLLITGLGLLIQAKESKERRALAQEGWEMLAGFIPRMMMRGGFTWIILATFFQIEGGLPVKREEIGKYALTAFSVVFEEEGWKSFGWKPWASNLLLKLIPEPTDPITDN